MDTVLKFGIPTIDRLLGKPGGDSDREFGLHVAPGSSTSIGIVGPDGAGKSVLALHVASRYAARVLEHGQLSTRVIYASTDLSASKAQIIWRHFGLDVPQRRDAELKVTPSCTYTGDIPLVPYRPYDQQMDQSGAKIAGNRPLLDYLVPQKDDLPHVAFLDLEAHTAGDDWSYITRLIAAMDCQNTDKGAPLHLLLIDAIEGLQMMNGERDAYGELRTRRSRIAELMRASASKCHLLFVVEEPKSEERFPEQFVADAVIRLHCAISEHGYFHRTLEIEKVRAQPHVRGQHVYAIRSGQGSTTWKQINPDDRRYTLTRTEEKEIIKERLSHVVLFPSLDFLYREEMQRSVGAAIDFRSINKGGNLAFGIHYFDDMLAPIDEGGIAGLPLQSVTGIIGSSKTHKSRLGRAFLSQCFRGLKELLENETRTAILERWVYAYRKVRDWDTSTSDKEYEETYQTWRKRAWRIIDRNYRAWSASILQLQEHELNILHESFVNYENELEIKKRENHDKYVFGSASLQKISQDLHDSVSAFKKSQDEYVKHKAGFEALQRHARIEPGVAVMITTEDIHSVSLAEKFYEWLYQDRPVAEGQTYEEVQLAKLRIDAALGFAESRTICRRLEVHSMTPALLFNIVKEAVDEAKTILWPSWRDKIGRYKPEEFRRFGQIRVVIDNWSTIASTYPSVKQDPLFLPYLFFYLKRQGVTTLILETHPMDDAMPIAASEESDLIHLVDHTLLTWNVRFHGRRMAALSPLSAFSPGQRSVAREIVRSEASLRKDMDTAFVDPHMELYQHLLTGEPSPVPLRVRLFTEGSQAAEYADSLNVLLKDLFPASQKLDGQIVSMTPAPFDEHGEQRYERLRQICTLHDGALDHTVVWQIDEFWAVKGSGGMQNLRSYLEALTDTHNAELDNTSDPYRLYRNWTGAQRNPRKTRLDFFEIDKLFYDVPESFGPDASVDRVPYTWDFGFLLCRSEPWKRAGDRKLGEYNDFLEKLREWKKQLGTVPSEGERSGSPAVADDVRVTDVWKALTSCTPYSKFRPENLTARSWRVFLEACKIVAQANKTTSMPEAAPAFDLSVLTPESVSCLMLEIWFSQFYQHPKWDSGAPHPDWIGGKRCLYVQSSKHPSLIELAEKYYLELYQAFILLFEVCDAQSLVDPSKVFSYRIREAATKAIAVRHWYKTAGKVAQHHDPSDPIVPLRLPGHFAVRGDWFLSIAAGSRSVRLGERAIDLITSRRANIQRLQNGVGLPTRILMDEEGYDELRTCLFTNNDVVAGHHGESEDRQQDPISGLIVEKDKVTAEWYPVSRRRSLLYNELLKMGASEFPDADPFFWLWRSHLADYDRHARIWHKWICRLLLHFEDLRRSRGPNWISGFKIHDEVELLKKTESSEAAEAHVRRYTTYREFERLLTLLVAELNAATPQES